MKFHNPSASIVFPKSDQPSVNTQSIQSRILGIGAHQDDLEFMCFHGILEGRKQGGFTGLILSNGAGSSRGEAFTHLSEEEFCEVRKQEQIQAANLAGYQQIIQLGHPSKNIKSIDRSHAIRDVLEVLNNVKPEKIYTHNPFDKHDSHIATLIVTIEAIKLMAPEDRPKKLFGCEVWRSLDWLPSSLKIEFDVSNEASLRDDLLKCFPSQTQDSKNYAEAVNGRRIANATFSDAHTLDKSLQTEHAIDLSHLIGEDSNAALYFVREVQNKFATEIEDQWSTLWK